MKIIQKIKKIFLKHQILIYYCYPVKLQAEDYFQILFFSIQNLTDTKNGKWMIRKNINTKLLQWAAVHEYLRILMEKKAVLDVEIYHLQALISLELQY